MTQIVLHACCAVCAGYPLELLHETGFEPTVFYFNPNIHPKAEYDRRLEELVRYCGKKNIKLITGNDDTSGWFEYVKGLENEKERGLRCQKCFEYRLFETAKLAKALNINKFTTTLFVSPHKVRKDIIAAGQKAAEMYGLEFIDTDFRKKDGFLKTMQIAKAEGFYRQKYCGCIYAQNEMRKNGLLQEE